MATSHLMMSTTVHLQAGGAINVGFDSFSAAGSCSAEDQATFSQVKVDQCLFQGNLATDHGGALGVQSGTLKLTVWDVCIVFCSGCQLQGHTHRMPCWCYVLCCSLSGPGMSAWLNVLMCCHLTGQ